MSSDGHNVYAPGHKALHTTHHEWRTAENSAAYLLPHLSKLASQDPNIKLLDVGAGSGTITTSFAKYMPQGQIVATDISGEVLTRAQAHADKAGVHNIAFTEANVYKLPFPSASFDVTHASQVLCHLDRPDEALAEMVRVTKPGGIVGVREADMRTFVWWPNIKECYDAHVLIGKGIEHAGGSAEGGRQLISWALAAGVSRDSITHTFGTWTLSELSDRKMWSSAMIERFKSGDIRDRAISNGMATEEEIEGMIKGLERWTICEDATMGLVHGELIIHVS
ncbi:methyltransferase domain-containing protein [Sarocladium implicatum]|nr:methyltransferase domain-containing protein [Sarocladium implicatum]